MSLFGPDPDIDDPCLSETAVAQALLDVKREVRNRGVAMVAPVVLAAAVLVAFLAAPPRHGGITLVPEAEASDENLLPRVFGANGVWRLAERIGDPQPAVPGPPWRIDVPDSPDSPEYVLEPPVEPAPDDSVPATEPVDTETVDTETIASSPTAAESTPSSDSEHSAANESLPASASSPPAPTLGQNHSDPVDTDWSEYQPEIRVEEPAVSNGSALADTIEVAPATPDPAGEATPPDNSSADENVTDPNGKEPSGDVAATRANEALASQAHVVANADTVDLSEANPSTSQPDPTETEAQPESKVATIVSTSVLVHRAHVSVQVQVVDDDSSVIDWCNTRVDWGDGSVTGLLDADGVTACTATCERAAAPSDVGIDESITFTHEYSVVIDAAPRIFVATGDGCSSYSLAELQLPAFTVVPY